MGDIKNMETFTNVGSVIMLKVTRLVVCSVGIQNSWRISMVGLHKDDQKVFLKCFPSLTAGGYTGDLSTEASEATTKPARLSDFFRKDLKNPEYPAAVVTRILSVLVEYFDFILSSTKEEFAEYGKLQWSMYTLTKKQYSTSGAGASRGIARLTLNNGRDVDSTNAPVMSSADKDAANGHTD